MLHKKVETLTTIQYKLVHNKIKNERGGRNCPKRKEVIEEQDMLFTNHKKIRGGDRMIGFWFRIFHLAVNW